MEIFLFLPPTLCSIFPATKSVSIVFFLFNLSELCIAKRYQETLSPQVFWVGESQQVCMVGPACWILNLKVSLPSPSLLRTTVLGHEWVGPTVNLGNNRSILTSSFACILWNSTTRSTYTLFIVLPHILPTYFYLLFLGSLIFQNSLKIPIWGESGRINDKKKTILWK